MVSQDRQQVIETNRSLRNIKNELEALLEKGVITEDAFDSIHRLLPSEGSLANISASRAPATLPTPATTLSNNSAPPPYTQASGGSTNSGPPPLPGRSQPPPPAGKPVVAHCKALYKYTAQDSRDCSFEKDDRIAVYEKMNADWWLGMNQRTREEGIFPKSYVEEEPASSAWPNEKAAVPHQPVAAVNGNNNGYPPPPGRVDPYNSHAPPMAMADGSGGPPSKTEENTKKFGKKLGNAAIFGAGATLGGKIVNSIF